MRSTRNTVLITIVQKQVLTHSLTHPLTHSFTYLLTHSLGELRDGSFGDISIKDTETNDALVKSLLNNDYGKDN